ncbi:MAG: hypothetical protein L6408_04150 [Nanoarchaeota archaeon]|nr:hypothetical protein [Nanoarchaeota archaeon]
MRNKNLKKLSEKVIEAYENDKPVILMMGAHVIKTGMSPYIVDLMDKGVIKHVAMNGAGSIHDFELSLIGETSEDVQTNLEDGTFGMSHETGQMMNDALKTSKVGYGKRIGELISKFRMKYKNYSILNKGYEKNIPVTIHVAIGTDIIHQHPYCDGAAIGRTSYEDFKIFTDSVSKLEGGVIINLGSAVILPEVFLKALTIARNLGYKVEKFTTANLDMIDHYRPRCNVVQRPTSQGGQGYFIKGKHERTVPTLYHLIKKGIK